MKLSHRCLPALLALSVCPFPRVLWAQDVEAAAEPLSFMEALSGGTPWAQIRFRVETADQDGKESAQAETSRIRLGYETRAWYHLTAGMEFEATRALDVDSYNAAGVTGNPDKSVIADPPSTEVNQVYLTYAVDNNSLQAGRQRLVIGNVRFVGDVGWRQNNQTFDALTFRNSSLPDTTFLYSYIDQANRIFGSEAETARNQVASESHALYVTYSGLEPVQLAAYAYLLDLENLAEVSTNSYGALASGKHALTDASTWGWYLEGAYQEDAGNNPEDYDVWYLHAKLGSSCSAADLDIGFESLGSDTAASGETVSFSTPLATLHKFNGWADVFLNTPPKGLEDFYIALTGRLPKGVIGKAVYHDFNSESGSMDYGEEIDLWLEKDFPALGKVILSYANYSADEFGVDTERLSVELNVVF